MKHSETLGIARQCGTESDIQNKREEKLGTAYAIASGLCYGLVGYCGITLIKQGFSIYNMLFWRFAVSAFLIFLIVLPHIKKISGSFRAGWPVMFYGAAFYTPSSIAYFAASKYIGTGLAMVTFFVYPALVMLLNWILYKTKIGKIYYFALALIAIGITFLVDSDEFKFDIAGIILGLLSALFYAFYIVASKKSCLPAIISTFMVSLGCMATCLICALINHSFSFPVAADLIYLILVGAVCTALPILLLLQALKYISSEQVALLSVMEPVFVVIVGIVLLGEKVSPNNALGVAIVITGALVTILGKKLSKNRFLLKLIMRSTNKQ